MEEKRMLDELFPRETLVPAEQFSPLVLAQLGDAVYELYIRSKLLTQKRTTPHKMHLEAVRYVKAKAQAKGLMILLPLLNPEEENIVRRGRNAKSGHQPKNVSMMDYRHSSAFEALIGYLYLKGQDKRLKKLLEIVDNHLEKEGENGG